MVTQSQCIKWGDYCEYFFLVLVLQLLVTLTSIYSYFSIPGSIPISNISALSFPLNIQDDNDLGDSGDDDAGSDVDTGSDDGGGDEGGGDMAYDAADREFPGYPDILVSAELPHKLNSTRTSEKLPSDPVTYAPLVPLQIASKRSSAPMWSAIAGCPVGFASTPATPARASTTCRASSVPRPRLRWPRSARAMRCCSRITTCFEQLHEMAAQRPPRTRTYYSPNFNCCTVLFLYM